MAPMVMEAAVSPDRENLGSHEATDVSLARRPMSMRCLHNCPVGGKPAPFVAPKERDRDREEKRKRRRGGRRGEEGEGEGGGEEEENKEVEPSCRTHLPQRKMREPILKTKVYW